MWTNFRFLSLLTAAIAIATWGSLCFAGGANARDAQTASVRDGSHDFDFLYGAWLMHNWRQTKPLSGSQVWAKFDATDKCEPLPGGLGNEDVMRTDQFFKKGFVGLTIRLYDPTTGLWRLYWVDNMNSHGDAGQPNIGKFSGNVGIFDEKLTYHGKPVIDRYTWTKFGKGAKVAAHFEESMSQDGGKTWEVIFKNDLIRSGK